MYAPQGVRIKARSAQNPGPRLLSLVLKVFKHVILAIDLESHLDLQMVADVPPEGSSLAWFGSKPLWAIGPKSLFQVCLPDRPLQDVGSPTGLPLDGSLGLITQGKTPS